MRHASRPFFRASLTAFFLLGMGSTANAQDLPAPEMGQLRIGANLYDLSARKKEQMPPNLYTMMGARSLEQCQAKSQQAMDLIMQSSPPQQELYGHFGGSVVVCVSFLAGFTEGDVAEAYSDFIEQVRDDVFAYTAGESDGPERLARAREAMLEAGFGADYTAAHPDQFSTPEPE